MISQVSRFRRIGHSGRRAEDAAHRTADLRRETNAHGAGLVQRDEHGLDGQAVIGAEEQFLKAVDG